MGLLISRVFDARHLLYQENGTAVLKLRPLQRLVLSDDLTMHTLEVLQHEVTPPKRLSIHGTAKWGGKRMITLFAKPNMEMACWSLLIYFSNQVPK